MRRSSMVKRLSFLAMMLALSVLFHYIESMIPPLIPIPGVKLGLANLISLLVLYYFSRKWFVWRKESKRRSNHSTSIQGNATI